MKFFPLCLIALFAYAPLSRAAVPPAEKLLPADTLGLLTIPDFGKARIAYSHWPLLQLWEAPELKAFREKFYSKLTNDVTIPLERELGLKFADFTALAQGQLTLALTPNGWGEKTNQSPGWVLLLDTTDKSEQLKKLLTELRKKWVDAGKQIKTEKIRDVDFTTLIFNREDLEKTLDKIFPKDKRLKDDTLEPNQKATNKIELTFGQSDSLLFVGNAPKDMEKILIRQAGGGVPALAEQPAFEPRQVSMFRDALVYGWLNFQPIGDIWSRQAAEAPPSFGQPFRADKALEALGLRNLKTLALNLLDSPDGSLLTIFAGAPESSRKGLTKILSAEAKDASPPPFVPADAVKFTRWRLEGQKAWATLESMLVEISPQFGGALKLILETAGKDKDPHFDLRKSFIGNLGDDFISYQKNPRGNSLLELDSPPTLYLLGSANADQLATSIKTISSLIPSDSGTVKEREFLGRKIYSIPQQSLGAPAGGNAGGRSLNFSANYGYLALSTDAALLEEFLRSSESKGKTLRETAGLNEAAQKVGGMGTGLFSFENNTETMRSYIEALKLNADLFGKSLASLSVVPGGNVTPPNAKDWFDFSLLPAFDKIAKYFHLSVYSVAASQEGIYLKYFSPVPPQVKK